MSLSASPRVLIVDDDAGFVRSAMDFARLHRFEVSAAPRVSQAREMLKSEHFDLVLLDLDLPDGSGLELLDSIDVSTCPAAVITGNPSVDTAVRALRSPVFDYVIKPLDATRFRQLLERAASTRASGSAANDGGAAQAAAPVQDAPLPEGAQRCGQMISRHAGMHEVFRQLRLVAPTDATVLVCGESGTGKELVAQAIHELSGRAGAFVAVNCGAVAPELLASQLFGHERGAFTGATRQHTGYVEQAAGGTLFLDEITEMPLALQTHLLRVLETRRVTRVGGTEELPIDIRIVAATNRDPRRAIGEERLRTDLYYRLSDFPVQLPALRDRGDDVELLARYFLARLNARYEQKRHFDGAALARLRSHNWPGNVRELRHVVQRAFILATMDDVAIDDFPTVTRPDEAESPTSFTVHVGTPLEEVERRVLLKTLAHFNSDKTKTAKVLGVSLKTIYNKLARY